VALENDAAPAVVNFKVKTGPFLLTGERMIGVKK
jgi:hypothetical protein